MENEERYMDKNLFLFEKITDEIACGVCATLVALEAMDAPEVNIWINTVGGEMSAMYAMTDMFRSIKCKVRTIALGECASAGMSLLMSGNKGMRLVMPNTSFMIHEFSWTIEGRSSNIRSTEKEIINAENRMRDMFIRQSNLTENNIDSYLNSTDTWMTAEEVVELGFADRIIKGKISKFIKVGQDEEENQ